MVKGGRAFLLHRGVVQNLRRARRTHSLTRSHDRTFTKEGHEGGAPSASPGRVHVHAMPHGTARR